MSIEKIREVLLDLPISDKLYVGDFPDFEEHKIGSSPDSRFITILINANNTSNLTFVPGGGKYLTIQYDVLCSIFDNNNIQNDANFTILTLKSNERDIEDYFLEMCTILVSRLGHSPRIEDVKNEIEKLESIFLKLSKSSKSSLIGVWGEVFIIENSSFPESLIESWHKDASDLYDFNDGKDKIEVKTTLQKRRVHSFEIKQLDLIPGVDILVASLQTVEIDSGRSLLDLITSIKARVSTSHYEKLLEKTFDVLGDRFTESFEIYFDYSLAQGSLRFFDSQSIPKPLHIPIEVSDVKFSVDLSGIPELSISSIKGELFRKLQ
jgi:hypothetical protein